MGGFHNVNILRKLLAPPAVHGGSYHLRLGPVATLEFQPATPGAAGEHLWHCTAQWVARSLSDCVFDVAGQATW